MTRPTFRHIADRIKTDIAARFAPVTPGSAEAILVGVVASVAHGLYGYADWIEAQVFPTTCSEDSLRRWAQNLDVPRRRASYAEGEVQHATEIPEGRVFRAPAGYDVEVTSGVVGSSGSNVVQRIRALAAGEAFIYGGLPLTDQTDPDSGIVPLVLSPGVTGGADAEDVTTWRARVVRRFRGPRRGGTAEDYAQAVEGVPGVIRACRNGPLAGGVYQLPFTDAGRDVVERATVALNAEVFENVGLDDGDAEELAGIIARMRKDAGDFTDPRPVPDPL